MPTILDHAVVLAFAAAFPLLSYFSYQSFLDQLEREGTPMRLRAYRSTMFLQWLLLAAALFAWDFNGREFTTLGLTRPETIRFWGGAVAALLAFTMILYHYVLVSRSDDYCRQTIEELGPLAPLLPRTPRELRAFMPVAITAGIVEEILFRGFLIWYLSQWMNLVLAAGLSLLIFTAAHAYQGPRGTVRVALVGLLLTAIYLLSGSLYPVIALHVALDIAGGTLARHAFERCLHIEEIPAEA